MSANLNPVYLAFLSLFLLLSPAAGAPLQASEEHSITPTTLAHIDVVLSEKRLYVRLGDRTIRSYPVAIGKLDHPTPEGAYLIEEMTWNPSWHPPDSDWASGLEATGPGDPDNPMRVVKIPFDPPYYYIHGTKSIESLGTLASHGCLRMSEEDVEELASLLMRLAGPARDANWLRSIRRNRKTTEVRLGLAVPINIRMGGENVYPGVVWDVQGR